MAAKKKSTSAKGQAKVGKVMHEYKHGQLKSGGKKQVKSRKQAVAIALNEARQSGAKVAPKKGASKKTAARKGAAKKTAAKKSASKKGAAKKSAARKKS